MVPGVPCRGMGILSHAKPRSFDSLPETKDGLNLAVGKAHKRYTRRINFREGWRGHLWQGRFASFVMDANYLLSCTKYIELNPVRAGLVKKNRKNGPLAAHGLISKEEMTFS